MVPTLCMAQNEIPTIYTALRPWQYLTSRQKKRSAPPPPLLGRKYRSGEIKVFPPYSLVSDHPGRLEQGGGVKDLDP